MQEINGKGGRSFAMKGDLNSAEDAESLVNRTVEEFGGIDILVNNAGGLIARKTISEMSLDHWQAVMDLNLTSTFLMIKACLPHLKSGAIVNLASQAGRDGGGPGAVAYATAKGAVMTMTRGLAKELGPEIRVNAICPGMIDTDFHNVHTKDEARRNVEAASPTKRQGTPDDIANLVCFLASDASAFVTGANVDINGGVLFSQAQPSIGPTERSKCAPWPEPPPFFLARDINDQCRKHSIPAQCRGTGLAAHGGDGAVDLAALARWLAHRNHPGNSVRRAPNMRPSATIPIRIGRKPWKTNS